MVRVASYEPPSTTMTSAWRAGASTLSMVSAKVSAALWAGMTTLSMLEAYHGLKGTLEIGNEIEFVLKFMKCTVTK